MSLHNQDPPTNESENHLIGNILAEEEDNSDSDQENNTKIGIHGVANSGTSVFTAPGKLGFAGAGPFGIGANAPYGGAFNNSGIPDRSGSAPTQELNVKYFGLESPQSKIHNNPSYAMTLAQQSVNTNQPNLPGQNFSNLFPQQDPFSSGQDPTLRRPSGFDYNQPPQQEHKPSQFSTQQQHLATSSPSQVQEQLLQLQQQANNSSQGNSQYSQEAKTSAIGGNNSPQSPAASHNQQDIYQTKEYYDYYHSLKPRDPRLPKPTFQPSQVDDSSKKGNTAQEELEKKLGGLTLNEQPAQNQTAIHNQQSIYGTSFPPENSLYQQQQPFSNQFQQQQTIFGGLQPQITQQQISPLQAMPQQPFGYTPAPTSQPVAGNISNQGFQGKGKKGKGRGGIGNQHEVPPPMPMPKPPAKAPAPALNTVIPQNNFQRMPGNQSQPMMAQGQFGFQQPQQFNTMLSQQNQMVAAQQNAGFAPQQQLYQQQSDPKLQHGQQQQMMLGYPQNWPQQSQQQLGVNQASNMNPISVMGSAGTNTLPLNYNAQAYGGGNSLFNPQFPGAQSIAQAQTMFNQQQQLGGDPQAAMLMQNYAQTMGMPQYSMQQMVNRYMMNSNGQPMYAQPPGFQFNPQQNMGLQQFGGVQNPLQNTNQGGIDVNSLKKLQGSTINLNNPSQVMGTGRGNGGPGNFSQGRGRGGASEGHHQRGGGNSRREAHHNQGYSYNQGSGHSGESGHHSTYAGRDHHNQDHHQMDDQSQQQTIQLPKSEFLEDLRAKIQNGKKIEIKDIKDHVVECSMDQYGSRFIQQKYDVTQPEEKDLIFDEILPEANSLMNDVFGNYVVQKLFEYGTEVQRSTLAEQLLGNVLKLTKSMYGCRVVQKALEVIPIDQQKLLVQELKDSVLECIYDQNGNHVIQKCIEKMPNEAVDFIVSAIVDHPGTVSDLCLHTYGCRVIQRILENCHERQTRKVIDQIISDMGNLTKDQFGNYVIQHILEQGISPEDKTLIVKSIKGKVIELSNHKFASNVVEKCLEYGNEKDRKDIIDEFLESTGIDLGEEVNSMGGLSLNGALYTMMKDRYGNYVIQKCIEVSKGKQREVLIKKITACANVLRKQANYSRHVYNFIEKMSTDGGGGETGPTGGNASQTVANKQHSQQQYGSGNYTQAHGGRGGENHSYVGGTGYHQKREDSNYVDNNYQQQQPHYVQKKQQPNKRRQ